MIKIDGKFCYEWATENYPHPAPRFDQLSKEDQADWEETAKKVQDILGCEEVQA